MKDLNDEYYIMFEDTGLDAVSIDGYIQPAFSPQDPAPDQHTIEMYISLGDDEENIQFYDIHFESLVKAVCKETVANVLKSLNLYRVQILQGTHGEVVEEYGQVFYKLWCYNRISCLDFGRSKYGSKDDDYTRVYDLEKIVLDSGKLSSVPEDRRLAFRLSERPTHLILHKKIVDDLLTHNFSGANYIPIREYGGIDDIFKK